MPPEIDTAPAAPVASPPAAAPAVSAPAPSAPVAATTAVPDAPKPTMLEAISAKVDGNAERLETNRGKGPRQPDGKFTHKVGADVATAAPLVPAKPGAVPVAKPAAAPGVPAEAEDLAMPEGLGAKAQERFQRLTNEVKELRAAAAPVADLTSKLDMATRQVEYVKTAFHEHGVRPEQFDQATAVIGMFNRGDYDGARKILEGQLQQLALLTGRPGGTIDALANFPDLREAVDNMQVTEAHALELARARAQQFQGERRQRQEQQQREQTQQADAAHKQGVLAVEAFCKRMQANDVDYSAVEEQLLPEIPNLIRGVPPAQWPGLVEVQYRLLKNAAGKFRQPTLSPNGNALRPTGLPSVAQAPKSVHEAMWGERAA